MTSGCGGGAKVSHSTYDLSSLHRTPHTPVIYCRQNLAKVSNNLPFLRNAIYIVIAFEKQYPNVCHCVTNLCNISGRIKIEPPLLPSCPKICPQAVPCPNNSDGLATLGRPAGDGEIPAGQLIPGYPEVSQAMSQGVTRGDKESRSVVGRLREFHQGSKYVYCQLVATSPKHISLGVTAAGQPIHSAIGDSGFNVANRHCQYYCHCQCCHKI